MFPLTKARQISRRIAREKKQPLRQDIGMKFCQSLYSTYYFYYSY